MFDIGDVIEYTKISLNPLTDTGDYSYYFFTVLLITNIIDDKYQVVILNNKANTNLGQSLLINKKTIHGYYSHV